MVALIAPLSLAVTVCGLEARATDRNCIPSGRHERQLVAVTHPDRGFVGKADAIESWEIRRVVRCLILVDGSSRISISHGCDEVESNGLRCCGEVVTTRESAQGLRATAGVHVGDQSV